MQHQELISTGSPHDRGDHTTTPGDAAHRAAMLRTYLARFGLTHEVAADAAAQRVLAAVACDEVSPSEFDQRLIATARHWIREFAGTMAGPAPHDWFRRAPALLSKFPTAFLSTPVPVVAPLESSSPPLQVEQR